jgi:hypothetical protein
MLTKSGELPTWLAGLAAATGAVLLAPPTTMALAAGAMLANYLLVNLAGRWSRGTSRPAGRA